MTARRLVVAAALLVTTLHGAAQPAYAQRWSVEVQAGEIRSSLDPGAAAQNLAVGVRLDDFDRTFAVSVGVPTAASDPLWGAITASQRLLWSPSGFAAGLDLAGSAYLMHHRETEREVRGPIGPPQVITEPAITGTAFAAQALPLIGYEAERWKLHVRTGPSLYRNDFGGIARERQVLISDVQLTVMPQPSVAVMPVVRRIWADEAHYTYAGASGVLANRAGSVWASAGFWPDLDSANVSWAAGVNWQLHTRAQLSLSGRRDAFDPLYLNPAQTSWSIGFAVQVGGPTAVHAPVPASYTNGLATIRLEDGRVKTRPMIAGDFTNWKPRPMQPSGNAWTYSVQLEPGVYNYAFVDANGKWFVPDDHPGRKDDGMGGVVAVLVVR